MERDACAMNYYIISITGADGSGKTTLTRWLKSYLQQNGTRVKELWSRYNNYFSKPLLAAARVTGHNYYEQKSGTLFGYHDFQDLPVFRRFYTLLQCIDVNIATWKNILRHKEDDAILICERGPWDTLADVMLDTGDDGLYEKTIGKMFVKNVMKQFKVIYISRLYENIIQTRPELTYDRSLKRKIEIYEHLCRKFGWHIIENNESLKKTKEKLIQTLHSKSI
jgi:thymidylate kinase